MIKKILLSILVFVVILYLTGYCVALKSKKTDSFFCNFDTVYWYGYNRQIRDMVNVDYLSQDVLEEMPAEKMKNDAVRKIFSGIEFKYTKFVWIGPYDLLIFSNQNGEKVAVRISQMYGTFRIVGESGYYVLNEQSKMVLEKEIKRMELVSKCKKNESKEVKSVNESLEK
jgi:hypothetical protein